MGSEMCIRDSPSDEPDELEGEKNTAKQQDIKKKNAPEVEKSVPEDVIWNGGKTPPERVTPICPTQRLP